MYLNYFVYSYTLDNKDVDLEPGVLSTKDPTGICRKHGQQNQSPDISMTPCKTQKWCTNGSIFQNFPKFEKNRPGLIFLKM